MDDFVNTFTNVVDRCFRQCANDFTTKAVTGREVGGWKEKSEGLTQRLLG